MGFNSENVFFCLVDEGRVDPTYMYHLKRAIIGPQAKRHYMAFRLRADDGQVLKTGLVAL